MKFPKNLPNEILDKIFVYNESYTNILTLKNTKKIDKRFHNAQNNRDINNLYENLREDFEN